MDRILVLFCSLLSCFIIHTILFQFMESRYKKSFQKKYLYGFIKTILVMGLSFMNLFHIFILNLVGWCAIVGTSAYFLYYEDVDKPLRRILECESLLLCMSVSEALGVFVLQLILQMADAGELDRTMLQCLEVVVSKIIVIFLYYLVINKLMKKQNIPHAKAQYSIYAVMLAYSLVNMLVMIEIFIQGKASYIYVVNMGCIVLADLYLLHFVHVVDEKNYYEMQVKALEQQANIQYEYYLAQIKKGNQAVQILHDVKKHVKMMQELYEDGKNNAIADKYVKEIGNMLRPLVPVQYTGNPILDILLMDQELTMKEKGISLDVQIGMIDLNFIDPIDVTTIFGNLLDNAIEAAEQVDGVKNIFIKLGSYHKMTVVRIENSCSIVKWRNGLPVSEKGKDRGIGLLNVKNSIEKYDGDLKLKQDKDKFIVELFLNS